MDGHAEHEIGALGGRRGLLDRSVRAERDADAEPERARRGDRSRRVLAGLDVERDAVAARLGDRLEVALGVLDHQMAVEHGAPGVHQRRDRREDDRADRDLRDEMAVTGVEMEDPGARLHERAELCAESREVGRVDRRLDLDVGCPVAPCHEWLR